MRKTRLLTLMAGLTLVGACGGGSTQSASPAAVDVGAPASAPPATPTPDDPAPHTQLDPCVVGTWDASEFTVPGPVPEMNGVGGAGALIRILPSGATEWKFDAMEPVVIHDDIIDVTTEQFTTGTARARVRADLGTWTVTEKETGEMDGHMRDNILGDMELTGGPGLFVGLQNGSYTCRGALLTYSTTDPVEDASITVFLHRR